jgi:hypothetical protein
MLPLIFSFCIGRNRRRKIWYYFSTPLQGHTAATTCACFGQVLQMKILMVLPAWVLLH